VVCYFFYSARPSSYQPEPLPLEYFFSWLRRFRLDVHRLCQKRSRHHD